MRVESGSRQDETMHAEHLSASLLTDGRPKLDSPPPGDSVSSRYGGSRERRHHRRRGLLAGRSSCSRTVHSSDIAAPPAALSRQRWNFRPSSTSHRPFSGTTSAVTYHRAVASLPCTSIS